MEKYREGAALCLHFQKTHAVVLIEESWYETVRSVKEVYESNAVRITDGLKVEVGLHQGSALFLFYLFIFFFHNGVGYTNI